MPMFALALLVARTAVVSAQEETQVSPSDSAAAVVPVADTAEVVEAVPAPMPAVGNALPLVSGCSGCNGVVSTPVIGMPMVGVQNCGTCNTGYSTCGTMSYNTTPMFAQVSYQQPITGVAQSVQTPIVTSAPIASTTIPVQQASVVTGSPCGATPCGTTGTPIVAQSYVPTTGCVGCGTQATGISYAQPVVSQPITTVPMTTVPVTTQAATGCVGCGTQATGISYAQPITQTATPTAIAAPTTYAPATTIAAPIQYTGSTCNNCGGQVIQQPVSTCNGCTPQRRGIRGLLNRR